MRQILKILVDIVLGILFFIWVLSAMFLTVNLAFCDFDFWKYAVLFCLCNFLGIPFITIFIAKWLDKGETNGNYKIKTLVAKKKKK